MVRLMEMSYQSLRGMLALLTMLVLSSAWCGDNSEANAGFVFVKGKYISPPYLVTAKEGSIYVNGYLVKKVVSWPINAEDQKPSIPPKVLKNAKSFDDLVIEGGRDAWHARMARWIGRTYKKPKERKEALVQFYTSLPFVKSARFDGNTVLILHKDGKQTELEFEGFPSEPPPNPQEILKLLEKVRKRYENRLSMGDTFIFLSSGLELSFGKKKGEKDLKLMTEVLNSKEMTNQEKFAILKRMAIVPMVKYEHVAEMFELFELSDELKNRIAKLIESSGVRPRLLSEIPAKSPAELEKERLQHLMKQEQERKQQEE